MRRRTFKSPESQLISDASSTVAALGSHCRVVLSSRILLASAFAVISIIAIAPPAHAYVGPGAGFAFLGSASVALLTVLLALTTIALWPIRWIVRRLRRNGVPKTARARRVVIVGLDGLDPGLVDRFIGEGQLPNLEALAKEGSYRRLGTTLPALSPVAWSSFQTGVNPGAHNIYDFLTRDKRYCLPEMSSTRIEDGGQPGLISRLLGRKRTSTVKLLRGSQPFWKILGERGIFSNIIRVPISYPPERFNGNILSAMCTPDLRGTQGSFSFFTSADLSPEARATGGWFRQLRRTGSRWEGFLEGPPDPASKEGAAIKIGFTVEELPSGKGRLLIQDRSFELAVNELSPWIDLDFRSGRRSVSGIVRFCVRSLRPEVALYVSPININPEKPALPIAEPVFFSQWLAKSQGPFGTLGLMEDTWGRNEQVLDDQRFLDQTYLNHAEREEMFFTTLDRTTEGLCACVFDASDRIQHMFWRYLDSSHPAPLEDESFRDTIPEMYRRMDALVGRVRAKLRESDLLFVMSDHGFASFRRGINLNSWLFENGYLALKNGKTTSSDYFAEVDWSKTRAFAVGLTGIYINRIGRELTGTVPPEEAQALKNEIIAKLAGLSDPQTGTMSIRKVYDSAAEYRGLYTDEAPDLIIGYEKGYRVSWDSVTGGVESEVFSDNVKAWSGDHHIDPSLVPGIFFTNRSLNTETPHITDIAPTVLDVFKVKIPAYMEGKVIL